MTGLVAAGPEFAESAAHLAAAFWQAPVGQAEATLDGVVRYANPAFARLLGYPGPREVRGLGLSAIYVDAAQRAVLCGPDSDLLAGLRANATAEVLLRRADGGTLSATLCVAVRRDQLGRPLSLLSWVWDTCGQYASLAALEQARSAATLQLRFDTGPVAMGRLDPTGRITSANAPLQKLLAHRGSLLGVVLPELVVRADRHRLVDCLAAAARAAPGPSGTVLIEVRMAGPAGGLWCEVAASRVPDVDGQPQTLVQLADVEARKMRETDLERRAALDVLTHLPNRGALLGELASRLSVVEHARGLALLFLDLDGFAQVNDEFGHVAGDEVLVEVARRLRHAVRLPDLVARLGGDTFVVVSAVQPGTTQHQVDGLSRRLLELLVRPVPTSAGPCRVTGRITVTHANPGEPAGVVLARADSVLHARKSPATVGPSAHLTGDSHSIAELLDSALDEGRMQVAYQPVVELASGRIVGAEALMRISDRQGRMLNPEAFIPVAESTGAIHVLGDWILRESVAQTAAWKLGRPADAEFALGVNMSPRQLDDPGLLGRVTAALSAAGLWPDALVLELTEQLLTLDVDHVHEVLTALRDRGIHLACDDFGTGFSSIRGLAELPLDIIKIDRSWTARLTGTGRASRLAQGVLQLTRVSGLIVVAEGVETQAERAALLAGGCRLAQGYLFAKPQTATAFSALLASSDLDPAAQV